jgi:hypothetical protein
MMEPHAMQQRGRKSCSTEHEEKAYAAYTAAMADVKSVMISISALIATEYRHLAPLLFSCTYENKQ